jgi:hypothetical protein
MMGSVDRMMGTLDDVDAERLQARKSPAPAATDDADSSGEYVSDAMKSDGGDTMGDMGSGEPPADDSGDDYGELRDAAAAGDTNARRILELIDEVEDDGNSMAGGDLEAENAALDKSSSDEHVTSVSDNAERQGDSNWSEDEPVQDAVGMYAKTKKVRR